MITQPTWVTRLGDVAGPNTARTMRVYYDRVQTSVSPSDLSVVRRKHGHSIVNLTLLAVCGLELVLFS